MKTITVKNGSLSLASELKLILCCDEIELKLYASECDRAVKKVLGE